MKHVKAGGQVTCMHFKLSDKEKTPQLMKDYVKR